MTRNSSAGRQSDRPADSAGPGRNQVDPPAHGGSPRATTDELQDRIFTNSEIAPVAYDLWLARGRPIGTDRDDWFEAERRLHAGMGDPVSRRLLETDEQARMADESQRARESGPTNRERMIAIGRGNQQAGRQSS
jgi:hypothetical protein